MKYFKEYLDYKIIKNMKKYDFKSPVLEAGCGTGETLELVSKYYDIKGIDLSEEAISICKKKEVNAQRANIVDVKEKYNSIISIDVVEHIEDDLTAVKHFYKSLNKDGKLFILVPSGRMMKDDIGYGHYRRYSKDAIKSLLEECNFKIEFVEMFGFPVLYYARILMNYLYKLKGRDEGILEEGLLDENTLRSSYEHPYDNTIFGRILETLPITRLLSKLLLFQNMFASGNKGFAVIVVASKS